MWCFDIYEEDRHIVVEGDLPGFEKADLAVFGDETRVVLSGSRARDGCAPERTYFNRERRLTTIHREIALPQRVRAEAAEVTLRRSVALDPFQCLHRRQQIDTAATTQPMTREAGAYESVH
ncbi:MAG: Hsp20/alpha crystallin family protein [Deltaproteobacteria bacterium]|nr:Hsp20/alpha crystallin family protein [Deltaproteobacteria bacterium]MBW2445615.1 Hsp20/alpha crystallin family protein [Deltaproteobacteria bacterium]